MKVIIASDHRGTKTVEEVKAIVSQMNFEPQVVGCSCDQPVDYPDTAYDAATAVANGKADRAILICGTGIGMSIAANKIKGVRAALCYDELTAQLSRQHNDANVLCLSADLTGPAVLKKIVEIWLTTEFMGGRHQRRVKKIQAIENGQDPRSVVSE